MRHRRLLRVGPRDKNDKEGRKNPADIRAVGVQSFANPSQRSDPALIVFAINGGTPGRLRRRGVRHLVDVNNDGKDDYIVLGIDRGAFETGTSSGIVGSYVYDLRTKLASISFLATAPTNSSTIELPVRSTQLCATGSPCLSDANPRFKYTVVVFDRLTDFQDETDSWAGYNPWSPSITQGGFEELDPGASASEPVTVNAAECARARAWPDGRVAREQGG